LRHGAVGGAKRTCVVPFVQVNVCGVVIGFASTDIIPSLVGSDVIVISSVLDLIVVLDAVCEEVAVAVLVVIGAKVAVSLIGPFIMTEAEAEVPLNAPEPDPVHETKVDPFHETKVKPLLGVASIGISALAFCHPEGGVVVPPGLDLMVRRYCCWYTAR